MAKFSTLDKILSADVKELAETEGIGGELAGRIRKYFDENLRG